LKPIDDKKAIFEEISQNIKKDLNISSSESSESNKEDLKSLSEINKASSK
jgi:hypothetical protein